MLDHGQTTELACEKLVKKFAVLNDLGRYDELADLFVEDGTFARPLDPQNAIEGRDNIRSFFCSRPPRLTRHFMTNILVEPISPDEAEGTCYVIFLSTTAVDDPKPVVSEPKMFMGEYRDHFVRTESGWRFKSRLGASTMVMEA